MSDKLSKAAAVYFTSAEVGGPDLGTRCGKCRDYIALSRECVIVDPPNVSAARGTCALYVHGQSVGAGLAKRLVSKQSAAYIEGADVPTYCGRCEYYAGDGHKGECSKVEGEIFYRACCNLYEAM
jgi:hypothetical protein